MNKRDIEAIHPLSPTQEGMLYESIRAPSSGIHIEQAIYTLTGQLNVAAFEEAWQWVVVRHAVLRTGFVWKERAEPLQVTLLRTEVTLDYHDWRHLPLHEQKAQLASYLRDDRARGFNVAHVPLMRVALFRLDEQLYRFAWTFHHIIMDGWSQHIVLNELISCYMALSTDQTFSLPPSRSYGDYVAWLKQQDVAEAESFWRKMLRGFTKPTPLGREQPGELVDDTGESYGLLRFHLSDTMTANLRSVARSHRLKLNTLLQGVWAILLGRYSQSEDVVFGVTFSGRPAEMVGVETIVGLCINTLPLHVQLLAEASLWSWLNDLQRLNLEMQHYEYCSAGQVHRWSDMPGQSLLYESLLVVENYPSTVTSDALEMNVSVNEVQAIGAQTKYPLTLLVIPGARLSVHCIYNPHLFASSSVYHILEHFQRLLEYMASDPYVQLASLSDLIPAHQIPIVHTALSVAQEQPGSKQLAPLSLVEELIASVWCEVLGVSQVDVESDFFKLGGHSLIATQMVARLRTALNVEIPLRVVFEHPTVGGLALRVEEALRKREGMVVPALLVGERPERLPLSFAQQRLWFLDQLELGSTAYLFTQAIRIKGALEERSLERGIEAIIERHESLRTHFVLLDEQPVQVIEPAGRWVLPVIDLQGLEPERREQQARHLIYQEAKQPCDLAQGPLLRIALVRLQPETHLLLLTLHHIITDRWSNEIMLRELILLYRALVVGKPAPLSPLPIQYADYALWQRRWLQGAILEEQLAYWQKQLARITPLALPLDRPRSVRKNHWGVIYTFTLSKELATTLNCLSSQEQVTLFMTLLAAFQTLLHHLSGQDDIAVGTDVTNRHHVEGEHLIGFFVNQLVLRVNVSNNPTFRELLREVKKTALEAYVHQDVPFEKVIETLRTKRGEASSSLFQAKFLLDKTVEQPVEAADELFMPEINVNQEDLSLAMSQDEDILLRFSETAQGIRGAFVYSPDLFDATTVARIARRFVMLVEGICANPDTKLDMLKILVEKEEKEKMEPKKKRHDAFSQFKLAQPKPIQLQQEPLIQTSYLSEGEHLPLVISPNKIALDLVEWAKSQQTFLLDELRKHGALLFRGFEVPSPADFERFALTLCSDLFQENGEHVPVEVGMGNLYTPVFYAPEKKLLWHNENSFNDTWPMKILFFCGQPAASGGETPIVDNRKVFERIDPAIREQFMQKGVMYVRNYGTGLGLPWQKVFRTESREEVEAFCRKSDIAFGWKDENRLHTHLIRPAVLRHPQTDEWVWWNQATHWHPACLDEEVKASLKALFAEEDLPRNCFYGDGSPIEDAVMDAICEAYQAVEVAFPWRKGDIMMLDNMLTAHARNPYEGQRKIYVSMGDMMTLHDLALVRS